MDRGYLSLLLEDDYTLSPVPQNVDVYSPLSQMYPYVAEDTKPKPYHFGLPELRSLEQLYQGGDPAVKRVRRSPERRDFEKKRRQTISEKYQSLQKLLPCDRKMDIGTMLEEAYKYVKFLQAQVSALQCFPLVDPIAHISNSADVYGGGLGRLSSQQLLEVVLNSPVAQKVLYSRGWCVYSTEQLELVQRVLSQGNNELTPLSYYY